MKSLADSSAIKRLSELFLVEKPCPLHLLPKKSALFTRLLPTLKEQSANVSLAADKRALTDAESKAC